MLTASGITLQFNQDGNLSLLLITAGSFIFAVSVKVTKIALIRERNKLLNSQKQHKDESNLGTV